MLVRLNEQSSQTPSRSSNEVVAHEKVVRLSGQYSYRQGSRGFSKTAAALLCLETGALLSLRESKLVPPHGTGYLFISITYEVFA
ncbi:hypothetical protein ACRARG_04440 [Pseudooceanicola sp. C21-150M6]|uniref:hypothetical protein n=1 Tax=Pseudooceanicola sp. C21-150M6 TaxID=3434355 RepID=UPI003D7F9FCC